MSQAVSKKETQAQQQQLQQQQQHARDTQTEEHHRSANASVRANSESRLKAHVSSGVQSPTLATLKRILTLEFVIRLASTLTSAVFSLARSPQLARRRHIQIPTGHPLPRKLDMTKVFHSPNPSLTPLHLISICSICDRRCQRRRSRQRLRLRRSQHFRNGTKAEQPRDRPGCAASKTGARKEDRSFGD
jgi:hypothetical protein